MEPMYQSEYNGKKSAEADFSSLRFAQTSMTQMPYTLPAMMIASYRPEQVRFYNSKQQQPQQPQYTPPMKNIEAYAMADAKPMISMASIPKATVRFK